MLRRGVLATVDVNKVAEAHVKVYEEMDGGACGRYLCFDGVIRGEDEVIRLEHELKIRGILSRERNLLQQETAVVESNYILSHIMGSMQADQLKQLRDIFARFDMDSDGSLTHLELAALLRSLGLKPNGDQIHVLLANIDSNGNGTVEFDELIDAIMPEMNQETLVNQEQLMEVFRSFDRDGNGYITAAELAQSMAKMGHPLTFRELTEMFREADTDGDGAISFTEFASVMAKSAADFLGIAMS
ncbi:probable calcium-binding protein CML16 isoform X2 [Magnolia sinica]|nr:probable calcium-binding protein CML16 isoform X2 [Magnolia sinica]